LAISITTLFAEVRLDLQESTSTFLTDPNAITWTNDMYSEYGLRMNLDGVTDYTWPSGTASVALTTVHASLVEATKILELNSDGNITGEAFPRIPGYASGLYIVNNTLYWNPTGEAPDEDVSLRVFYKRVPVAATAVSDNIDIPSGYERAVMKPYYMARSYEKMRKLATAEGYMAKFERAFKRMMVERYRQLNPMHDTLVIHGNYAPLTGG
jgi:hypothetical protein